jgi:hypothetical protein
VQIKRLLGTALPLMQLRPRLLLLLLLLLLLTD